MAEAEVLADRDLGRAEALHQLVVDERLRRLRREGAVERDHDQLVDAERRDQVGLLVERRQQLGRRLRRDDRARVRFEGHDAVGAADDLAMAGVHAVELAHREAAGTRRRVGKPNSLHQPRKPTTGLRVAPPRGSAMAIRPSSSRSRIRLFACPGTATPWAALAAASPSRSTHGQEGQRVVEADQALLVGVGDVEAADVGAPQLDAVRVVQVGDQRAHVGARRALDREGRELVVARELLEAGDLDLALGDLDDLAGAGAGVGALAVDLDRGVDRRALGDAAGRQRERLLGHLPRRDLALRVAGRRRVAEPRDGLVALGQLHQEALDPRPAADEDEQQAGRERVQRARVADLHALAQPPPHLRDDVVRRHPWGLVDE